MKDAIQWFREKGFTFDDKITIGDVIDLQNDAAKSALMNAQQIASEVIRQEAAKYAVVGDPVPGPPVVDSGTVPMFNFEGVYDREIYPLMYHINKICERVGMPVLASFCLRVNGHGTEKFCTTFRGTAQGRQGELAGWAPSSFKSALTMIRGENALEFLLCERDRDLILFALGFLIGNSKGVNDVALRAEIHALAQRFMGAAETVRVRVV